MNEFIAIEHYAAEGDVSALFVRKSDISLVALRGRRIVIICHWRKHELEYFDNDTAHAVLCDIGKSLLNQGEINESPS